MNRYILSVGLASLIAVFTVSTAFATNQIFRVQSNYPYRVQIEFYSQARDAAWPGDGMAYDLNDGRTQTFNLDCDYGEQICYGAWVTGDSSEYWGVGYANQYSCDSCCLVCGHGEGPVFTLEP